MPEAAERQQLDEGTKEVQGEDARINWLVAGPLAAKPRFGAGNIAVKEEMESHSPILLACRRTKIYPRCGKC
jgi:hypothetical protein